MSESVRIETESSDVGDIAVIVIDNPPVNALSWHVRQGLFDGLAKAVEDGAKGVVVICDGRTFIAGADITEFGGGAQQAVGLHEVQAAMEDAPIPVIAAIHGTALGGGLETALAAHYRVAVSSAKLGLPEVNLGLLPGGGGTQRLPRLTGVPKALEMMTSGRHIGTAEALESGLVDEVVDGDLAALRAAAVAFAAKRRRREPAAAAGSRPRRQGRRGEGQRPSCSPTFRASIAQQVTWLPRARSTSSSASRPPRTCRSRRASRSRVASSWSWSPARSRRRSATPFFAERAANKIPDIAKDTPIIDIQTCGVLGAGTMGGGIAMNFANVGIPVTIVERDQAALDRGLGVVRKNYERSAVTRLDPARGRRAAHGPDHRLDRQGRLRRPATSSSRRCSRTWS